LASPTGTTGEPETRTAADVRLLDLRKRFGEVDAVDGISLEIRAGEFFSLLGPSGCGKTTTLRMIGGFELPTSGRIVLGGEDITKEPPEKRPVNMVFQSYALFPHLTVFENVAFGLRRHKVPGDEVRRRVGAALELVHMTGFDARKPEQLSGGQQQRIALARALVNEPRVLLLDEPLGALDLKLRRQLQVELKRVQLEVGITFVYVTHDQEEALALSDRIAVIRAGHVEQLGTPEELYDRPETRFVADFIGTTNLLSGSIEPGTDGTVAVRLPGGERCLIPVGHPVGASVELAIRPELMQLALEGGDDPVGDGALPLDGSGGGRGLGAHVLQSAYLGTSVSHQVETDGGLVLTVVAPRSAARPSPGDRVRIGWNAVDVLVLEAASPHQGEESAP
jgi:spermidine/putrescine transport system ATP-binding protein